MAFFGLQDLTQIAFLAEDARTEKYVIYKISYDKTYAMEDHMNELVIEKKELCAVNDSIKTAFLSIKRAYELPYENGLIFHNENSIYTLRKGQLEDVRPRDVKSFDEL